MLKKIQLVFLINWKLKISKYQNSEIHVWIKSIFFVSAICYLVYHGGHGMLYSNDINVCNYLKYAIPSLGIQVLGFYWGGRL